MIALKEYLKIKKISILRYWKTLPVGIRIIAIIGLAAFAYLLYRIQINISDIRTCGSTIAIYIFLSLNFNLSKSQKLLLNNYRINIRWIYLIRTTLVSMPFFIVHPAIGGCCLLCGGLISLVQPEKISVRREILRFKPRYYFRKGSYQWDSFYRFAGFYVHLFCLFLMIMGLIHDNNNLALVSLIALGIVLGVGSVTKMEALFFLKAYPTPASLVRSKTIETLFNQTTLMLPGIITLLFFGIDPGILLYITGSVYALSIAFLCIKYGNYPDGARSQLIALFWIIIVSFGLISRSWPLIGVGLIITYLYYKMYQNLVRIYSNNE